jgi:peptide-methionine (S)-S-oxide reductase
MNNLHARAFVHVQGGGCFWCLEACYQMLKGVSKVHSGYAGGKELNPTYQQVSLYMRCVHA